MAGLQRSAVSFRRQGSSGLIWDDKFLSGELNQHINHIYETTKCNKASHSKGQPKEEMMLVKASSRTVGSMERSRSNGNGRVPPAIEPSSPKVYACGLCRCIGKKNNKSRRGIPYDKRAL
ncbi:PREDICTED: uncharacterized protein At1g15400-like [Nicotiana attenuata]|uniref:MAPK kinase substrate protein At1g80180-like n=1 Tax=Nicotiana attenuata TaxID=49451 RepID=A0A1J6IDW1_NICAT|nr:PREDICTED: uncharacterized protein At1g15400-like [Nicotiana attenuata]OIT02794.1 uncharacterized protein A4A49_53299 [Nicotiana attenuata]